jgi:hypothetical protein
MLHMQVCVNTYSYIRLHAYFVLAFCINSVPCFMRMSTYKETHAHVSVLVHWHLSCVVPRCCTVSLEPWLPLVYCQKQSHPPHTCMHLSPPRKHTRAYALVYDSKTNPSHRKHVLHMHVHVHILICTCIRLLPATVLDKCLHVCRAARLQDKMHSIISQSVRVQYSSDTYWEIWIVCVFVCVILFDRERKRELFA